MLKVGIVVDNPHRDLHGASLLSYFLAKKGFEVFLIPMYEQELHIRRLRPDLVILNYARRANARAIKAYHDANIKIAILDTEGGILRCEYKELVDIVEKSGSLPFIDFYFCWGKRQYDAFRQRVKNGKPKLFLTGSPRFDFYHDEFSRYIPRPDIIAESFVLVPTSFSFNNPLFATPEQEIENMRQAIGGHPEELRQMQAKTERAMKGLLSSVEHLARKYPNLTFVIRPHPFEKSSVYHARFQSLHNICVRQDGNVAQWLKHARFVIQLNSSTAVEATLLKRPVISLEMFQDSNIEVSQSGQCSIRIKTESQLNEIVELLLSGETNPFMDSELKRVEEHIKEIKEEWLNHNDGQSCKRIASILSSLLDPSARKLQKVSFKWSQRRHFTVWPAYFMRRTYSKILKPEREMRRKVKYFSVCDVTALIDRVKHLDESFSIEALPLLKKIPSSSTVSLRLRTREIH